MAPLASETPEVGRKPPGPTETVPYVRKWPFSDMARRIKDGGFRT